MPNTNGTNVTPLPDIEEDDRLEDYGDGADYEPTLAQILSVDNVAELMTDDELRACGQQVIRDYEIDKHSRAHREDRMDEAMKLALQVVEPKNYPWPKAANVIYPLITSSAIKFADRAYPALINGDSVCKGVAVGDDSGLYREAIDERSGELLVNPETGQPEMEEVVPPGVKKKRADRIAKHMSYQFLHEEEEWEEDTDRMMVALPILGCLFRKRFFDPELGRNTSKLVFPKNLIVHYNVASLDVAPRITEEIELYPYEIEEKIRGGVYLPFDYGMAHERMDKTDARGEGDYMQDADADAPHVFLQQLRRKDLDGDGYPEPYVIMVHKESGTVCRIAKNFVDENVIYNRDDQVRKIVPETYYIKYPFIRSPDGGFYDIGFGEVLMPINKTINTTINQMLDSGHLSNTGGGFIGRGVRMKRGPIRRRPGEFMPVDTRGQALRDNIYELNHPEPSLVLFNLLGMLVEASKDISGNRDILSGEQTGEISGITLMQLIDQGLTAFKGIFKRVHRAMQQELKLQFRLNGLYLEDKQYFRVLDDQEAVARDDYNMGDADVIPVSDPSRVTDMQKMAEAQILMDFREDPFVDPVELRERILKSANIETTELVRAPEPQPDLMAEAEMRKAENDSRRLDIEEGKLELKAEETMARIEKGAAEIEEILARATERYAEAEDKEAGRQIELYIQTLNNMREEWKSQRENLPTGNMTP